MINPIKIDSWAESILVDPLDKGKLTLNDTKTILLSTYGRAYRIVDGIYDLRLLNNNTTEEQKAWLAGQVEYENWTEKLIAQDSYVRYQAELESVNEVYQEIPVIGECLDVGGHQGRLRHFLKKGQKYISCDPFINVFERLDVQPNLLKAFPFLIDPVNFICCQAEFLPFANKSFDTVHMRSVIDHFLSPELALNEAYRVLRDKGQLIVGLTVHGGKTGKLNFKTILKESTRKVIETIGIKKYADHHIWHPTYKQLLELIQQCGFKAIKTHWQKDTNNQVCYIQCEKQTNLQRKT